MGIEHNVVVRVQLLMQMFLLSMLSIRNLACEQFLLGFLEFGTPLLKTLISSLVIMRVEEGLHRFHLGDLVSLAGFPCIEVLPYIEIIVPCILVLLPSLRALF